MANPSLEQIKIVLIEKTSSLESVPKSNGLWE